MSLIAEKYKLLEMSGESEFAIGYLAKDIESNRDLFAKVLRPRLDLDVDEKTLVRFIRKAKLFKTISFPHLAKTVEVLDKKEVGAFHLVIREYVKGEPFDHFCCNNLISNRFILESLLRLIKTLDYLRGHNISHGNIKPSNVYVEKSMNVKLLDVGIGGFRHLNLDIPSLFISQEKSVVSDIKLLGAVMLTGLNGQTFDEYPFNILSVANLRIKKDLEKRVVKDIKDLLYFMVSLEKANPETVLKSIIARIDEILIKADNEALDQNFSNQVDYGTKIGQEFQYKIEDEEIGYQAQSFDTVVNKSISDFLRNESIDAYNEQKNVQSKKSKSSGSSNKDSAWTKKASNEQVRSSKSPSSVDDSELKESTNYVKPIVITLVILIAIGVGYKPLFKKESTPSESQIKTEKLASRDLIKEMGLENSLFFPVVQEISSKSGFDHFRLLKRIQLIENKLKGHPERSNDLTYIALKIEQLEVATVTSSEMMIHQILDEMLKDLKR